MLSTLLGTWVRGKVQGIGILLARTRLSPNWFTFIGLMMNILVAAVIASGSLLVGGILTLIAGGFDMLDGAVARATNQITRFGGFFDSTLDRYSEAVVYLGILIYFQRFEPSDTAVILVFATAVGSLMGSYTRARAEGAGLTAEVGIFARPERVAIVAIFLIIQQPLWGLWILAIITNISAAQRIYHVWKITRDDEQR